METLSIDKKPIPTVIMTPFNTTKTESIITEHGLKLANNILVTHASWENKSDKDFTIITYVNFESIQSIEINCSINGITVILYIQGIPYSFYLVTDIFGYNELVADK